MLTRARILIGSILTALLLVAGVLVLGPQCARAEEGGGQMCCKPVLGGECCTTDTEKCCEAGFWSCEIKPCAPI